MTRSWMLGSMVLLSGCSLIVPSPGDFTADLVDGGQSERDAGRDAGRDAWVEPGTDAGPACEAGLTECGGDCVDTQSDLAHCGGCDNACAATDRCREGACFDPVVEVAAGREHTCLRRASGQVWCWGSNTDGQLGDGTIADSSVPVRVPELTGAVQIAAGGIAWSAPTGGTCARFADGTLDCWGALMRSVSPARVVGLGPTRDVAVSNSGRGCAVTTTNQLWCWGLNGSTPEPPAALEANAISGAWASEVEASASHLCVLGAFGLTGHVFCWGSNFNGQLGDGTTIDRATPVRAGAISDAIALATSSVATCVLHEAGEVSCWGSGQALGVGRTDSDPEPSPQVVTGLADAVAIDGASFGATTCAIRGPERRVACWGWDIAALVETGDISSSLAPLPVEISGLRGVVDLAVGGFHACAVLENGSAVCWGDNDYGQLGDGTMENRAEPTPVAFP